jgi:hypothetical protein
MLYPLSFYNLLQMLLQQHLSFIFWVKIGVIFVDLNVVSELCGKIFNRKGRKGRYNPGTALLFHV